VLAALAAGHPAIGLTDHPTAEDGAICGYVPESAVAALRVAAAGLPALRTPHGILDEELTTQGWLRDERLAHLLQRPDDLVAAAIPLAADGKRVYIAGFGLCETALLDELQSLLGAGPVDLAAYRQAVVTRIGAVAGIDTLVLHLLSRGATISPALSAREHAA
jgi:hypothetical protein